MTATVSAADRLRDAVALALFVAGAALFAYAYRGMRTLAAGQITLAPEQLALTQWARYRDLAFAGGALVALGLAAAVYSYWRRTRRNQLPR